MSQNVFPKITVPVGLGVNDKKLIIVILFYELGFFDAPKDSFVRKSYITAFKREYPWFHGEHESQIPILQSFFQQLIGFPKTVADNAYVAFCSTAKRTGLWDILRPKKDAVLFEARKYHYENSLTESDFNQILLDLKVTLQTEKEYYREYLADHGIHIVQELKIENDMVTEYQQLDGTLPHVEIARLFDEMHNQATSYTRQLQIREIIFMANMRLVPFVLQKMRSFGNYTPARDQEDDLQEGRSALLLAIDKFDVTKGNQFSTYAVQCIRGNILRFRNKNRYLQHVPENQNLTYQKANKTKTQREAELGREITIGEWAQLMGMPVYKLEQLVDIHQETVYFGSPVHSASEDLVLEEIIADTVDIEDEVVSMTMSELVSDALAKLESREEDIIRFRWGIFRTPAEVAHASMKLGRQVYPSETITFEEIATAFGITRERVRQILDGGIRKMRHFAVSQQILEFIEDAQ